jgi:glycosyltransferase involved in cell wall biosynthesis
VTGFLVENGNAEAVASAIDRLRLLPDLRERLGARGRVAMRERFSLGTQIRAYEKLYDECVAQHRRGFWQRSRRAAGVSAAGGAS